MRDVLSTQMDLLSNMWADEAREAELKKRRESREQRTNRDLDTEQQQYVQCYMRCSQL